MALERQWLEATSLLPDNLPELPALLTEMMGAPVREPMARRILEALGRNYATVIEAGYQSLLLADHLDNTLEASASAKARQCL